MDILTESFQVDFITKDDLNIKKLNNTTGCMVCGENHITEHCSIFDNLLRIKDSEVPFRAQLTLPPNLKIETLADGTKTIIATNFFPKRTQYGPFEAKQLYSLNPFAIFPIKIFSDSENILPDCYLDTTNEEHSNWMCYVAPAHNLEEQNLICYQLKQEIYFSAIKDIKPGDQLKVWYSPYYAYRMGTKIFTPKQEKVTFTDLLKDSEKIQKIAEKLPASKLGAEQKQSWICRMCGSVETNVVTFAKHLQCHYIKMIKNSYICDICNEGFASDKCLTKHRKMSHTVFTQVKLNEVVDGDGRKLPLNTENEATMLEDDCMRISMPALSMPLPIEQLMGTDEQLMLEQLGALEDPGGGAPSETQVEDGVVADGEAEPLALYAELGDVDTLREILCDDSSTKASRTAQEKSIADFRLDLVESGAGNGTGTEMGPGTGSEMGTGQRIMETTEIKSHICDICNKQFQTLQYLCRHLKKHTGEYTCLQCLVVFTRKENFQKHSCFVSDKIFNCSYCSKSFLHKKYLIRHMGKHTGKYTCTACGKQYSSLVERDQHNCPSVPLSQKKMFPCQLCGKKFFRELYLRKHVRNCHKNSTEIPSVNRYKETICEICAEKFKNIQSLKQHMVQHSEPKHECVICHRKFHRRDVLTNHLLSHGAPQVPCPICAKKLKTKKCLKTHMLQHGGEKRYTCEKCGKKFLQRTNMLRHQDTHSIGSIHNCNLCDKSFMSKFALRSHQQIHFQQKTYKCQNCDKSFSKNYLLKKHYIHTHLDRVYSCPYCSRIFKHRNSIRRHLHQSHASCKAEWSDPLVISSFLVEAKNMDIKEASGTTGTAESIPVIPNNVESEQQITLGKNAFILEDGTIVQPQDEGNIMIYVLDQQFKT